MIALLGALFAASMPGPGTAASSSGSTIGVDVLSSTLITNGCTSLAGRSFGTVSAGSSNLTSTVPGACRITFGSNNATSSLRISQADGTGAAMGRSSAGWAATSDWNNVYNDAVAIDATTGFAAGPGRIGRTMDGGSTWSEWVVGAANAWVALDAEPGGAGPVYVAGYGRGLVRVTNLTAPVPTFTSIDGNLTGLSPASQVSAVAAAPGGVVYVGARDGGVTYIYKSVDSGATFAAPAVLPFGSSMTRLDASSATDVWMTLDGAVSGVWRNTTGGTTAAAWSEVPAFTSYTQWESVAAAAANDVYVAGAEGRVWHWNGIGWTVLPTGTKSDLLAITAPSAAPGTVWIAGDDGEVRRSTDGGAVWNRVRTSIAVAASGVSSIDGTAGIVAGYDRWAAWVSNGVDMSGHRADPSTRSRTAIGASPVNGQRVVAVASDGVVERSTNGGAAWTGATSGTTEGLHGVDFGDDQAVWVVGDRGTILRSADAGATWTSQASGTTQRLYAVEAVDKSHAWAVGDAGTVLHTTNGGSSWSLVPAGTTEHLRSVSAWNDSSVVVAGTGTAIRRTTDTGQTWAGPASQPVATVLVLDIEHANATTLFAATANRVWRSTDGGANWTNAGAVLYNVTSIEVFDEDRLVVGAEDRPYASDDGGATWTPQTDCCEQVLDVARIDEHTAIAVGEGSGQSSIAMSVAANETISDYGVAPSNWAGAGTSTMFGACVQALGGGASIAAGWTVDGGTCTVGDADPWKAIPVIGNAVATLGVGASGTVDFVWGARFAASQKAGRYSATIAFEVLAP